MLDRIDEGLWVAAAPHSLMGLHIGARMTVVRLANGALWVHSPIALTAPLRAAVTALGPVKHLVAPNLFHHVYVGEWTRAFPDAALHAPASLAGKRDDLRITTALEGASREPWAAELVPVHIDGCKLDETVFVHRGTRTVVSADLTENFATSDHWPTRMYLKAGGIHGKVGWSRLMRFLYSDHAAARRSLDGLLEHDFDRVILAHGDVLRGDGKAAVKQTFEFLS